MYGRFCQIRDNRCFNKRYKRYRYEKYTLNIKRKINFYSKESSRLRFTADYSTITSKSKLPTMKSENIYRRENGAGKFKSH